MSKEIKITKSSGNVYEDLGFKDAKDRLVKADLAIKIIKIIERRNLTQSEAAMVLGCGQPKISDLSRGRLSGFSVERLIDYLNLLDQDVEIIIHQKPKRVRRAAHFIVAHA